MSWDQVKLRCEQLNVDHVPELFKIVLFDRKQLSKLVEKPPRSISP